MGAWTSREEAWTYLEEEHCDQNEELVQRPQDMTCLELKDKEAWCGEVWEVERRLWGHVEPSGPLEDSDADAEEHEALFFCQCVPSSWHGS